MRYKDYCDMLNTFKLREKGKFITFYHDNVDSSYYVVKASDEKSYRKFCNHFITNYDKAPASFNITTNYYNYILIELELTPKLNLTKALQQEEIIEKYPEYFL